MEVRLSSYPAAVQWDELTLQTVMKQQHFLWLYWTLESRAWRLTLSKQYERFCSTTNIITWIHSSHRICIDFQFSHARLDTTVQFWSTLVLSWHHFPSFSGGEIYKLTVNLPAQQWGAATHRWRQAGEHLAAVMFFISSPCILKFIQQPLTPFITCCFFMLLALHICDPLTFTVKITNMFNKPLFFFYL